MIDVDAISADHGTCHEDEKDMWDIKEMVSRPGLGETRTISYIQVTCLPPHSLSMIFFFSLYGMADRDGFLMRMFYFLDWNGNLHKLTHRIAFTDSEYYCSLANWAKHTVPILPVVPTVTRHTSPTLPLPQWACPSRRRTTEFCLFEWEGTLDDSGEEHIRSESDRALSARAN